MLRHATGRPEHVYGRLCKLDQLEHEVWITEAELLIDVAFTRSPAVGETIADAGFRRGGNDFYVEVDNGTMTSAQMRRKWKKYAGVTGFILVICRSPRRLKNLMASAEAVASLALFSCFSWLADPTVAEPWIDLFGRRTALS